MHLEAQIYIFPTGPCSIWSCSWCLRCRLPSCTNTQKLHPTLHPDHHHPGPALLHCRHAAAAAAKYSNPTWMMQPRQLGELYPPPSLCLSVVRLPSINWRLNTRCKEEKSGQRPPAPSSLPSNYHEQSHCNRTKVMCLSGDEVEDLSYRIEVRRQCVFVTEMKGFPLGDRSLRLIIVTSGTNTETQQLMFDLCAHWMNMLSTIITTFFFSAASSL